MNSDDKATEQFHKHILGCVQVLVFAVALSILAMTCYRNITAGDSDGQDKLRKAEEVT